MLCPYLAFCPHMCDTPPLLVQVQCCIRCLSQGVNAAHIIDGRSKHSVLMELLTDEVRNTNMTVTLWSHTCDRDHDHTRHHTYSHGDSLPQCQAQLRTGSQGRAMC